MVGFSPMELAGMVSVPARIVPSEGNGGTGVCGRLSDKGSSSTATLSPSQYLTSAGRSLTFCCGESKVTSVTPESFTLKLNTNGTLAGPTAISPRPFV